MLIQGLPFCFVYISPGLKSEVFSSVREYITDCIDFILNCYPDSSIYVCGDLNRYDLTFLTNYYDLDNVIDAPTFGDATLDEFNCPVSQICPFFSDDCPSFRKCLPFPQYCTNS